MIGFLFAKFGFAPTTKYLRKTDPVWKTSSAQALKLSSQVSTSSISSLYLIFDGVPRCRDMGDVPSMRCVFSNESGQHITQLFPLSENANDVTS